MPRYIHRVPAFIGQYGFVMSALKLAGSRFAGSAPMGSLGAANGLAAGLSCAGGLGGLVAAGPVALLAALLAHPAQMSVAANSSGHVYERFLFMSPSPSPLSATFPRGV
jgi:hypothetical protein